VADLLVLWDVDYTLVSADGLGTRLYEVVFREMFGNIRPLAALKLRRAGLGEHLDLDAGAYGDAHEIRAELVAVARRAASRVYGQGFDGTSTVLVGDTPLDVEAALATGARVVAVATGSYPAVELAAAGAEVVLPDLTDTAGVVAAVTLTGREGAAGRAR